MYFARVSNQLANYKLFSRQSSPNVLIGSAVGPSRFERLAQAAL
jgi:hypothetical protein